MMQMNSGTVEFAASEKKLESPPTSSWGIRCKVVPIRGQLSSSDEDPEFLVCFNRYEKEKNELNPNSHVDGTTCSVHHDNLAIIQCSECIRLGISLKESLHCSTACYLDSWKRHHRRHIYASFRRALNKGCNRLHKIGSPNSSSWPPIEIVSLLDHTVELFVPGGKAWFKAASKVGSVNIYIPVGHHTGLEFELGYIAMGCSENVPLFPGKVRASVPTICGPSVYPRHMVQVDGSHKSDGLFRVLSYNILSDVYANHSKYSYCAPWALSWEYRQQNLLHEIVKYDADILCLQEVQSDHFLNFFKPELQKLGYASVYKKRTKELYTANGYIIDGCATFFRSDHFKEVITYELEYGRAVSSLIEAIDPKYRAEAGIRFTKDNVAVVLVLDMVEMGGGHATSSRICVANTHIHAKKQFPDVKLCQVADLMNQLEEIIDPSIPLIICGDMNSLPDSHPHKLLTDGKMNPTSWGTAVDPLGIYQHLKLHHSIKLASAYSALVESGTGKEVQSRMVNPKTREPLFTNLTWRSGKTLDYIFYTDDLLVFCRGDLPSVHLAKEQFQTYGALSRLQISLEKIHFYLGGVSQAAKLQILSSLQFRECNMPFKYLGVP